MAYWLISPAIFLLFVLLRYYMPVYHEDFSSGIAFEELQRRYQGFDMRVTMACLVLIPLLVVLWGMGLKAVAEMRYAMFQGYVFFIPPDPWYWFFPAIFLSVISFYLLSNYFIQYYWQSEAPLYREYYLRKYQFDAFELMDGFSLITGLAALVMMVLGLNWYTLFTESELRVKGIFATQEQAYAYQDIARIAHVTHYRAPNGSHKATPYWALLTNNGTRWTTRFKGAPDEARDRAIIAYLLDRTGLILEELELIEEWD